MADRLVFADSEVGDVTCTEGAVRVRFSAAAVVRMGESSAGSGSVPMSIPVSGYAQSVELVLVGTRALELNPEWMGRVADGRVAMGGRWQAQLPLPFNATGSVEIELRLANGSTLAASATGLACRFFAEPNFNESLFC